MAQGALHDNDGAATVAQEGPERSMALPLSLLVVAFGLLVASLWVSIGETSVYSFSSIPSRCVFMAACFAIAWSFRSHVPSVKLIAWVGATLSTAGIALHFLGLGCISDAGAGAVVAVIGMICGKAGLAMLFLLAVQLAGALDRKVCAVGIPVGFLVGELVYCLCAFVLPSWFLVASRYATRLIAAPLMLACVYVCLDKRPIRGMRSVQRGFSSTSGRTVSFLESDAEWGLLLLGTTLFPFLFSATAQLCLVGGGTGLYDPSNEIAAACCFVLLAFYGAVASERMTYGKVLALCVPFLACGLALLPWFGGTNGLAGQILIKTGFIVYQTLFWVLLVCKVHDDPRRAYLYGGLFLGLFMLAKTVGRSLVFSSGSGVQTALLSWKVAVAGLWIVSMYTLAFFVVASRAGRGATRTGGALPSSEAKDTAEHSADPADPFILKLDGFCARYRITPREREVMELAVHGYTASAIGRQLYITPDTVKTHLRRVYGKAGVENKQGLIAAVEEFPLAGPLLGGAGESVHEVGIETPA